MDKKTKGSWLIYQTGKLQNVTTQDSFENTFLAGKSGILLSALSQDSQNTMDKKRVEALAKASNINTKLELPVILNHLQSKGLLNVSASGVDVLGVTTATCLQHTADLFESLDPSAEEIATIELCEKASNEPLNFKDAVEQISDEHSITTASTQDLLERSSNIGFVDSEFIDSSNTLLFNGNLFRRNDIQKLKKILDSLTSEEQRKQLEFSDLLSRTACITVEKAKKILGDVLFNKLTSVGVYDISVVSNSAEEVAYE